MYGVDLLLNPFQNGLTLVEVDKFILNYKIKHLLPRVINAILVTLDHRSQTMFFRFTFGRERCIFYEKAKYYF